jgi:hypothetical protein
MVTDKKKDSPKTRGKQGSENCVPEPNKINASTPYDFSGKNLTPYGGLLPVITMLDKLGFQPLVEQTVTCKRIPRAMDLYRFVLGIVLGLYIGFPRLNQLRSIARDPILTGILKVAKLPVQSTFWRLVNALHRNVARQILTVMRTMRERVWAMASTSPPKPTCSSWPAGRGSSPGRKPPSRSILLGTRSATPLNTWSTGAWSIARWSRSAPSAWMKPGRAMAPPRRAAEKEPRNGWPPINADEHRLNTNSLSAFICVHRRPIILVPGFFIILR